VVGLGKLGACVAAILAARGFRVVGADVDAEKVRRVNAGEPPVREPGLATCLGTAAGRLSATTDVGEAILASDVTFILVPTPSQPDGRLSLRHVLAVVDRIGEALRQKSDPHDVVVSSTVMPGDTGGVIREHLEKAAGRLCGEALELCYNPAFVALGSVIRDFLNPDFVLVGESDPQAGERLAAVYHRACENDPPIERVNLVDAELIKLSVNAFVTTKISFANALASICERLPGADADVVARAVGRDRRIGPRYLTGGAPYGGPCFPRDSQAFAAVGHSVGVPVRLAEATDRINRERARELADQVRRHLSGDGTIGILGLAYKAQTSVIEESPGVRLALALASEGARVTCHDPEALGDAAEALRGAGPGAIAACRSAADCVRQADVVVLMTPWDEYRQIPAEVFVRSGRPRVVIDCWRLRPDLAAEAGVWYRPVGMGPAA
jgi:UDPglucose 6-dehydrogenase